MQLSWHWRGATLVALVLISVVAARGTLRQGPPLRWGDAFTTDSVFINQLGLNPALTLYEAAKNRYSDHRDNAWKAVLPEDEALAVTRELLLTGNDQLADPELAAVRRD